ncbi:MAG: hypothetical protein VB100_10260 [Angelakisella sp.]|nr:hypothetical protein [Angelakisella sp.]
MKKYLSVFELMARSTIYRILILLVAMAAVEGALFWFAVQKNYWLEETFNQSRVSWAYAAFFVLLTATIAMTGCEHGAKTGYTLRRLQISEMSVFLCQATYNIFCYFIFWTSQVFIVYGLFHFYTATADASSLGAQSLFLAFYRNDFLHSLLPLDEVSRYVRNGILILCLGITSAYFPVCQRAGKAGKELIVLVCVVLLFFASSMGGLANDVFLSAAAVIAAIKVFAEAFAKEAQYEA